MPLRTKRVRPVRPSCCAETLERRQLLAASVADGVWLITGDENRRTPADVIAIAPAPQDAQNLIVTINGTNAGTAPTGSISQIRIESGRGNDRITIDLGGSSIPVTILAGHGNDRVTAAGEADTVHGGGGNDRIDTGGGADSAFGDKGNDQLTGGDDDDQLRGGAGNDLLAGGFGRDSLFGEKGADRLRGGGDDDSLDGGVGNDRLAGGDGADTLAGGKGADINQSQEGIDVLVAPGGSPSTPSVDKRDTVTAEVLTTPATRQEDDEQLKKWLIEAAVKQWKWAFDQPAYSWGYHYGRDGEIMIGLDDAVPPPVPTPTPTPAPTPSPLPVPPGGAYAGDRDVVSSPTAPGAEAGGDDHSDTNTQEQGVDEADLVETDGNFLYTLRDKNLVIVDATPADQMTVLSRSAVDGDPLGIYLHGNRVTVVSATYSWQILPMPLFSERAIGMPAVDIIAPPPEPPKLEVHVTVFDVSDKAAPTQVEQTTLEGTYGGSRLVGDRLYLVISNDTWVPQPEIIPAPGSEPDPDTQPGDGGGDGTIGASLVPDMSWRPGGDPSGVYESEASYRARLEAMPLSELLPSYTAESVSGETSGVLIKSDDAYVRDLAESSDIGQNLTTVTLLNVGDAAGGPSATSTVAGFGGTVYASADALYLAGAKWGPDGGGPSTRLMKFQLGPDAVPLVATGDVSGRVLDQFSMDEDGDTFRVATTGFSSDPNFTSTNSLFVLEHVGDELNVIGDLTNIKNGETLRSARFVGDRAYLVTFRQIDPLFTVNLDDPTNPFIAGQLVIPGFSSYLQPIGDGLLLGLGRDIDPQTQQDRGVQLSLFDVSDDANPKRIAARTLTDSWEHSEAELDHHAFAYFSEQRILALPVSLMGIGGDFTPQQKLLVLRIDPAQGSNAITELGAPTPPGGVRRSLRIADALYAVTSSHVQSVKLEQPEQILGAVEL